MNSNFRALKNHSSAGFTLIELMIAVAVVGILAGIAYPSYMDSVRKSRRGQAKADLLEAAQMAERYRTVNNTYVGFGKADASGILDGAMGKSPHTGKTYYNIKLSDATANTFTLTAEPVTGAGQEKDKKCLSLIITHTGEKKIGTGATGTAAECW